MAWNEPGNNNNNGGKDPWGNRNNNGDGPPDFDEIIRNLFGSFMGKKKGGNNGGGSSGSGGGMSIMPILIVGLVLVGLFLGGKGFGIVNEQERAVVLRLGSYHETVGPGLRWNPPFIDSVYTANVTQVRQWGTQEEMLTQDLNIVDIKLSVQYRISSAQDFVLNIRAPEESLRQAANSALRHVVGSKEMHNVLTEDRAQIAIEVKDRLQDYLDGYTSGIMVEKVNVEDSNPPKEVQDAFDDVINAREDEERFQSEARAYANKVEPDARGEKERMLQEANAYREEVIARADGEAERFTLLLNEYKKAPEVTRKRLYIDTVQQVMESSSKILVDVEGGNNMMYLPLDKLVQPSAGGDAAARGFSEREVRQLVDHVKNQVLNELPSSTTNRRSVR